MHALRKLIALILVAAVLIGCDSVHRDQFRVRPLVIDDANGDSRQHDLVAQALAKVANVYGFTDSLHYARAHGVVAYFTEDSAEFPIAFGARRIGGELIVDLSHFVPGTRESPRYVAVRSAIIDELTVQFGSDAVLVLERRHHVQ
jgi:hypothetical protein